jgi:hypothetical protein
MADFTKLNESIAKLGSALEAFFGAEKPPRQHDQPAIDAAVKHLETIMESVPAPGTKLPVAKPDAPKPTGFATPHETPKPVI